MIEFHIALYPPGADGWHASMWRPGGNGWDLGGEPILLTTTRAAGIIVALLVSDAAV